MATSVNFNYEEFFSESLQEPINFMANNVPLERFHLQSVGHSAPDSTTVYSMVLEETGTLPVMKVSGEVHTCNIHPLQVARNRPADRESRVDRYVFSLSADSEHYKNYVKNSEDIVFMWQEKKEELRKIVTNARKGVTDQQIEREGIDIVFGAPADDVNEVKFVRNVAAPRPTRNDSPVYVLLPTPAEQTRMRKPGNFHWRPKIPVVDSDFSPVDTIGTNVQDETADVYFQLSQSYFGNKVRILPEMVGIMVKTTSEETPKKKARKSMLF